MKNSKSTGSGVWIHGASGRMGQEIAGLLKQEKSAAGLHFVGGSGIESSSGELLTGLRDADCIVDFSNRAGNLTLLEAALSAGITEKVILIGSTGLESDQVDRWNMVAKEQKLILMIAPNTSLGISLTLRAALSVVGLCSSEGFDVEIEETHHRDKQDAPGGTALYLADQIAEAAGLDRTDQRTGVRKPGELGVHATRGGGVFGEHKVRILGDYEEITISHRAFSRTLFAKGALYLLNWLRPQKPGVYTLSDVYQAPGA